MHQLFSDASACGGIEAAIDFRKLPVRTRSPGVEHFMAGISCFPWPPVRVPVVEELGVQFLATEASAFVFLDDLREKRWR